VIVKYKNSLKGKIYKKSIRKSLVNDHYRPLPQVEKTNGESIMREKAIERKLTLMVKKQGGICPKFVSPGFDGVPDRIVLLPGGCMAFVEVKAPGKKPRALQVSRHTLLRKLGFRVYVLDNEEQIGGILDEIRTA
jgi:hypothetical protein